MKELEKFRIASENHNLCQEWQGLWDSCKDKKSYMDMALNINSIIWICKSITEGWGLSPAFISSYFRKYINGNYVSTQGDSDSEMYCDSSGEIDIRTDVLCLINFNGRVNISSGGKFIYIAGNSNVIINKGVNAKIKCYIYGENAKYYEESRYNHTDNG